MKPTKRMLITVFLGFLGVHKFMDGRIGMGFLYLFTMGLGGIGWIVDSCKAIAGWCKWIASPNTPYHHPETIPEPEPVYNFNQP